MATATQTRRDTRRQTCGRHGIEWGQSYDPGVPGQRESVWLPPDCPACEKELRADMLAAEKLATRTDEIRAEAERRIAADTGRAQRIREAANKDLEQEATKMFAEFYAAHREEREAYHNDEDWNRVVAEIEAEFFEQLKKED